nr:hypothetical protein BaRGS_019451 [Batillaria attramentaria]
MTVDEEICATPQNVQDAVEDEDLTLRVKFEPAGSPEAEQALFRSLYSQQSVNHPTLDYYQPLSRQLALFQSLYSQPHHPVLVCFLVLCQSPFGQQALSQSV